MSTAYRHPLPDAATGLIRARSEEMIRCCAAGGPAAIRQRLDQLDREWDVDRILAAAASGAVLGGLLLGSISSRKWYLLPALAGGFLLQHALQGACPPLSLLRQLGVRYRAEIDQERRELHEHMHAHRAPLEPGDIPATHPVGRPSVNDYVETAAGRIKPASQA